MKTLRVSIGSAGGEGEVKHLAVALLKFFLAP